MNINLPLNSSKNFLDTLKMCILYYDKVNIALPYIKNGNMRIPLFDDAIKNHIDILIKDKIISYSEHEIDPASDKDTRIRMNNLWFDWYYGTYAQEKDSDGNFEIETIYDGYLSFIESTHSESFMEYAHSIGIRDSDGFRPNPGFGKMGLFFLGQLSIASESIYSNNNFLSDSIFLETTLKEIHDKDKNLIKLSKNVASVDSISVFIPNIANLSFEDVLELKKYTHDELLELQHYISSLASDILAQDDNFLKAKNKLHSYIEPSVNNLRKKASNLKLYALRKAFINSVSACGAAQLLTTTFPDIPCLINTIISLGFFTSDFKDDYLKRRADMTADPLYFTLKLK